MPISDLAPPESADRIESWKEIASFLRRDVRTVQRWEKPEGLPVHRHMHGERGTVYAYPRELEEWWKRRKPHLDVESKDTAIEWQEAVASGRLLPRWIPLGVLALAGCLLAWRGSPSVLAGRQAASPSPDRLFALSTSEGARVRRIFPVRRPAQAAVSPDGSVLYVTGWDEAVLAILPTATLDVARTIRLSGPPNVLVVSHDGHHVYVGTFVGNVDIIDAGTHFVRTVRVGGSVQDLLLTPDDGTLFLTTGYSGLKRLDTATGRLTTLPGVACPMFLAMNPAGTRLFVSYQCGGPGGRSGHDAIDIVDVASGASVGTISGPPLVGGPITVSPDGSHVWVEGDDACLSPSYDHAGCPLVPGRVLHAIRTSDRAVVQSLGLPSLMFGGFPVFLHDGRHLALPGRPIEIIDASTMVSRESLDLGDVAHLALSPDGRRAYVPLPNENAVAVLDAASQQCEPPQEGLAHFWPADGNANDVPDGTPGTLKAGAQFAPGRLGQAFRFLGDGGYVSMGLRAPGGMSFVDMTIALWVRFSSPRFPAVIVQRLTLTGDNGWRLFADGSGAFAFCIGGPGGCRPGPPTLAVGSSRATADTWYHVAMVKKGNVATLYVNGSETAGAALGAFRDTGDPIEMRVGAGANGGSMHGMVDELAIYHRALSLGEIRHLAAMAACPAEPAR